MIRQVVLAVSVGTAMVFSQNSLVRAEDRSRKDPVEWTDNTGKYKVNARFRRLDGNAVVLRLDDGRDMRIPFDRLSRESVDQAKAMASGRFGGKSTAGSDSSATASSSSTSNPSPASSSPGSSSTLDNLDAKTFVDRVMVDLRKNNVAVLWDAMPSRKQRDLEDLVVSFAKQLDSRTFDSIRKTRNTVFEIARKQQQFILNSSVLTIPSDQKAKLEQSYPAIIGLLESYLPKDFFDSKRLQKGDLRELLTDWATNLNANAQELAKSLPEGDPLRVQLMDYSGVPYTVESTASGEAKLTMQAPAPDGGTREISLNLVQSEGRWLPREMVDAWDGAMAQAKAAVATIKAEEVHQMVTTGLLFANAPLQNLKNAKTQEEFDKVLKELMGAAQGMAMGPMGGSPPGGFPPGGPPPGGAPGGFPPPGRQPPPTDAGNSGAGSASTEK